MFGIIICAIIGFVIIAIASMIFSYKKFELDSSGAETSMEHRHQLDMEKEKTAQKMISLEADRIRYKVEYSDTFKQGMLGRNFW